MKTRNRTPAERAILYAGVFGGLTLEQTNALLEEAGFPGDVPESSWEMLRRIYVPKFKENPLILGECIYSPRSMGDLQG